MNNSASPEYSAKILGKITPSQYESIGYFFENNHLDRLANKVWPANLRTTSAHRDEKDPSTVLRELSPLLEDLALSRMFTRNSASNFQHLPTPHNEAWAMFVTSVNQAIGRSYMYQTAEIPAKTQIVTQNELRRALTHYPDPLLHIQTREFALPHRGEMIAYGIPDDLVMKGNIIGGVDVTQFVDYYPEQPTDATVRTQLLKDTLKIKKPRKILRHALGNVLNLDPGWINIPDGKPLLSISWGPTKEPVRDRKPGLSVKWDSTDPEPELLKRVELGKNPLPKIRMVIGAENENKPQAKTTGYDGDPISIGLPSMEVLSLWLLRILAGNIPQEANWRKYFTQA